MQVINKKIDEVRPYSQNNRIHSKTQIARIARSIKEFGFNQPLVVDSTGEIIVGHGRYMAALELGLTEVPVIQRSELTEEQMRAYRILDNKLQNDSDWDFKSLFDELTWLEEEGFDLDSWGLNGLFVLPEEEEVFDDENSGEPDKGKQYIVVGDVIELGRVCHGIEIDPKYCQAIIERYKNYCTEVGKDAEVKVNGERLE